MILIKKYIVVNINNEFTEIILLSRRNHRFQMENKVICKISLMSLNLKINEHFTETILNSIKDEFIIDRFVKGIYFNIQNDQIIIRNIENIKTKKHNEIINLIKFEINKYMPIDLQEYKIRYKIIKKNNEEILQSILFPRKFVDICNELSEKSKIKKKYLNINFDILQKLISSNLIELSKDSDNLNTVIMENRLDDLIVNLIFNNQILESYILAKNDRNKDLLTSLINENYETYYYGITDDYIKTFNIEKLNIKLKLKLTNKENLEESINYICALGMII